MTVQALTQAEFDDISEWIQSNAKLWPEREQILLQRLLLLYQSIAQDKKKASDVVKRLREAMGLSPKSERGNQIENK